MRFAACMLGAALLIQASDGQEYADIPLDSGFPTPAVELDAMRAAGDLNVERNHMWRVFSGLTRPTRANVPIFMTWYGAGEVFADASRAVPSSTRGLLQSLSLPMRKDASHGSSGAAPLIIRAHYNESAFQHIRVNRLESAGRLLEVATTGGAAGAHDDGDSIPAFSRDAVVVKTVWWPIPQDGIVALPVWDAAGNPPRAAGNDYLSWSRVVAVSGRPRFGTDGARIDVEFLGRPFKQVRAVGVDALYHITLDQPLAESLMSDPEVCKVAGLVLGRPLRANDMLGLVAMHVATRELPDWVWGTFWWHDRPDEGQFAPPQSIDATAPWRNYRIAVSFDATLPREPDGSPHVAFNPWLEGRFPDGGNGSGVVSNCMSCHQRASTAADRPFLVTRAIRRHHDPPAPASAQ